MPFFLHDFNKFRINFTVRVIRPAHIAAFTLISIFYIQQGKYKILYFIIF